MRVRPVWVVPLHSMPVHHRQCEGLPVVTRDSRYGYRGVRIGEASNPGPPRTRARARIEREAEVALTGLEAAITRIDDSSDDEPLMPTWRDEVGACAELGRAPNVRNVWARMGESHTAVVPTLLDSLGSDEPSYLVPEDVGDHSDDECSSARSESCWGEMEDIGDDEVPEWGVTYPLSRAEPQGGPSRHSQRETVAASSLPDGVDSAHTVGDVEGVVVTNVEACDRWAFPVDAAHTRRTKRLRIEDSGGNSDLGEDAEPEVGSGVLDELQRDLEGLEVFPMTDDAEVEVAPVPRRRQSRRLVLVSHRARSPEFEGSTPRHGSGTRDDEARDDEARQPSESDDTVSLPDGSVVSGAEEYIAPSEPDPTVAVAEGLTPPIRAALARLDEVDLETEFQRRGAVMKTVPHFLRGPYRSAMRLAMGEALQDSEQRRERGWKLFLMLPRLLLYRPCRGGNVHKEKLSKRFQDFSDGRWTELLAGSRKCAEDASQAQRRKRRRRRPEEELGRRAARAFALVQLGELSSGRQALEGASVANGTQQTLEALRDPDRRPPLPRDPLPEAILEHEPEVRFSLEAHRFAANLRSSRRGAAAGLSGMTTDHLRLVLDQVRDTHMLCQVADQFAQARIPPAVHNFLRLGRLTALQKPRGGVRGIVVGDVLRRLVARTMAQQLGKAVEAVTAPHQYAYRMRGTCIAGVDRDGPNDNVCVN